MEDYVNFEIAKLLKEAGFDWCVTKYWRPTLSGRVFFNSVEQPEDINQGENFSAPSLAQAQKWLRETEGLALNISAHDRGCYSWSMTFLPNADNYDHIPRFDSAFYDTYEQCLSVALNAALGMITSNTEKL